MWNNGATTDSIYGLSAGTYSVMVTDANGCSAIDTAIVSLNGISASVIITDSILCYGDLATIDVITSGGIGWYLYQLNYWTPFWGGIWLPLSQQTTYDTATFLSVPADSFRVTIIDLANNNIPNTISCNLSTLFRFMAEKTVPSIMV